MHLIIQAVCAVILAVTLIPSCASEYIAPDEIGIRKNLSSGISPADFSTERARNLPLLDSFRTLPATIQYLELNRFPIRNQQNNTFFVDMIVAYRIKKNEGHQLAKEGLISRYRTKVDSAIKGFLRENMAQLTNERIQVPDERIKVTTEMVPPLNKILSQYHVEVIKGGILVKEIRFGGNYEKALQAQQENRVQGLLSEALQREAEASTLTDTIEKEIERDVAIEQAKWKGKIAEQSQKWIVQTETVHAETRRYIAEVNGGADAYYTTRVAEGEQLVAEAEALGERLRANALNTRAGRTFAAIQAAKNFELGETTVNGRDPRALAQFGSVSAWEKFFLGSRVGADK